MRIEFKEEYSISAQILFDYFKAPADLCRLYGLFGSVRYLGEGWYSVPLKGFPFPLVAKVIALEPNQLVHWTFGGFWRGDGEVRFSEIDGKTIVEGYEEISVRCLFLFSPLVERMFLEKGFRKVWRYGWRRLRKLKAGEVLSEG